MRTRQGTDHLTGRRYGVTLLCVSDDACHIVGAARFQRGVYKGPRRPSWRIDRQQVRDDVVTHNICQTITAQEQPITGPHIEPDDRWIACVFGVERVDDDRAIRVCCHLVR